ncbi:MAG: hypothetical protein LUD27_00255 [Clostridia bacterium]|nr:hypothetical protein [Clostridia bacterium]
MWNKESVMLMLENLGTKDKQAIQNAIDYDKYINSEILNADLCGSYAPFCACCPLHSSHLCAKMYAEYRMRYKGYRVPILSKYSFKDEKSIQKVIDFDKYYNSQKCNSDLCGSYASFCSACVKQSKTPCADAYLSYTKPFDKIKIGTLHYKKKAEEV